MKTFVDELAVRKVAESIHLPEDVVRKIVKARMSGLGFRRISRRIREVHNYELGKDRAREVLLKYDELARPTELPPDREVRKTIDLNRMRTRKKTSFRPISMPAETDLNKKIDEKNDGECLKWRMRLPIPTQPLQNLTSNTQMTKLKLGLNRG